MDDRESETAVSSMYNGQSAGSFDVRIIPEFDGSADVVEWWTRAEMLCEMKGISVMSVLPTRLTGGAFRVWSLKSAEDRKSTERTKAALYDAFGVDKYMVFE